jgi:peptidyl-prolyl cis-trans isomerase A (cyclophilin A)
MTKSFKRRDVLAGVGALAAAGPAFGQAPPVFVILRTEAGNIGIALDMAKAPITAGNFLRYVTEKRMDNGTFYRAMRSDTPTSAPYGIVQGGPDRNKARFPAIAHEPTSQTGLSHVRGAVSIARGDPGSATCDFFICIGGMEGLDAKGADLGFAVFGRVVDGMDVVEKIHQMSTVAEAQNEAMRGQMLGTPVKIISAMRLG